MVWFNKQGNTCRPAIEKNGEALQGLIGATLQGEKERERALPFMSMCLRRRKEYKHFFACVC